jgi:hypothetical protein
MKPAPTFDAEQRKRSMPSASNPMAVPTVSTIESTATHLMEFHVLGGM